MQSVRSEDDPTDMAEPGNISNVGMRAMMAGAIGELRSTFRARVLDDAGLLSPSLAEAHETEAELARSLTRAGIELSKHERIGRLLDVVG